MKTKLSSQYFDHDDVRLHYVSGGKQDAPCMVFLHGFPEYWAAWQPVFSQFVDDYHVIAPDQRGFNLSSKPSGVEAYDTKYMVADLLALIDHLSPNQPIILCGHDWGASVAYAFAMRHAARVEKLIIANGVHPMCFQKALFAGGAQTKGSQYMNRLREPGMADVMSVNGYKKLFGMLEGFSPTPWLDDNARQGYFGAWSQPGAVDNMLNWYRASPMVIPPMDASAKPMIFNDVQKKKYSITMPHLLIWGMDDPALLPEARADLHEFCDDLTVVEVEGADHWIIHSHGDLVAREIKSFLS